MNSDQNHSQGSDDACACGRNDGTGHGKNMKECGCEGECNCKEEQVMAQRGGCCGGGCCGN